MLYLTQLSGLLLITLINGGASQFSQCSDLVLDPPELVVRYGDPVSVSCRSLSEYTDLGWIVSLGNVSSLDNQTVIWKTDNLTDWEIQPACYKILNGVQCRSILPLKVYKLPDEVSFSIVNHVGPMVEGKKYELQCDVYNFAPVNVLAAFWYKGEELLKNRGFSDLHTKTPRNKTVSHKITAGRDEGEAQYWCEAKLKLGPAGPQPSPTIKSNLLKVAVHYKPVIKNCSNWSPMINTPLSAYPHNVTGNPTPNITWHRDKSPASPDMILSRNDSGTYGLLAINKMGRASCAIKITVEYAPTFKCPAIYEGREHDSFLDKCSVMASPVANISWEKDGKMVNPLQNLTRRDSGLYVITAVNKHGVEKHRLTVNVLYGPEIEPGNSSHVMQKGEAVTLSCTAEGNPEPEVTWSFQSQTKATGRRQTTLTISKATHADDGVYTCTAMNDLGNDTRTVKVQVEGDCPIKIQPVKLVVEFGTLASANCSTSTTHHGMGWEASQGPVDMEENVQLITWRVDHLTHWDIEPFCFLNTEVQCSLNLPVIVYKRPDRVSISTVDHKRPMTEGRQYTLLCDVHNVAPVRLLTVNWYKGPDLVKRESFSDGIKFPANKNAALQISPSKDDDGVQYRCEAELNLGPEGPQPPPKVTSDPLDIIVHRDCPIKIQPVKLVVEFGASASANCSTTTIHHGMGWEASQGPVDMEENVQLITWRVDHLTHWDIKPLCYINIESQCLCNLPVIVYKRPDRVSISTVDHTGPMTEGRQYTLLCDVHNVAPVRLLTVNWYKGRHLVKRESFSDGITFPANKNAALQISPSKDDDGVQYKCEAELKLGPEGPQPPPKVTSDPLNITVH